MATTEATKTESPEAKRNRLAALEREHAGIDQALHHAQSRGEVGRAQELAARKVVLPGELIALRLAVAEGEVAAAEAAVAAAVALKEEAGAAEAAAIEAEARAVAEHRAFVGEARRRHRDATEAIPAARLREARAALELARHNQKHHIV